MRLPLATLAASAALLCITSAAEAAPAWFAPHDLAAGANTLIAGATVAPDGAVTTAFVDHQGSQHTLRVAVKPPGQPFRAPIVLSKPTGRPGFAYTAADRAGNVVMAWEEELNGAFVIRAVTKPAGGEFTAAQSVSDSGSSGRWPRVAIAGGKAVIVWAQGGRVRAAAATAGAPFVVEDPLSGFVEMDEPGAVAAAPDGSAVVAWRTYGKAGTAELHAAARPAGGGEFATLPDVASVPTMHIADVKAAMSSSGRATLAWTWFSGSTPFLQSASRGKTGKFGGVETVANTNSEFTVAMADDDSALIAWTDAKLRYAQRPSGGGFDAPRTVPGSVTTSATPQAVLAPDGSARVLWLDGAGPRDAVQTARIAASGASEFPQTVSPPSQTPTGQNDSISSVISLAANDHGDAVAAWFHTYDAAPGPAFDTRARVRTAILDSTPPVISAVNVPGATLLGRPTNMSLTTRDALSGATANWDFGDGTTEEGETLTKTFTAPGEFTVRVTVTDSAGNATVVQRAVTVAQQRAPL